MIIEHIKTVQLVILEVIHCPLPCVFGALLQDFWQRLSHLHVLYVFHDYNPICKRRKKNNINEKMVSILF